MRAPAPSEAIAGSSPYRIVNKSRYLCLTSDRIAVSELASIDGSTDNRQEMPSAFLTFRCRRCQQGRCVVSTALSWAMKDGLNELSLLAEEGMKWMDDAALRFESPAL
jgi:hypothetical protein